MHSDAGLNARFLVRRDDELIIAQGLALPITLVKVQHLASSLGEVFGARENPTAMLHGRIASASSQRQIVVPLMCATTPRLIASRTKSSRLKRDSGRPLVAGSSQAIALICITTSGGKTGRTPGACFIVQACTSLIEKSLTPLADDLSRRRKTLPNLLIRKPVRGQENNLGAEDSIIR
jgi:hypothetical protein